MRCQRVIERCGQEASGKSWVLSLFITNVIQFFLLVFVLSLFFNQRKELKRLRNPKNIDLEEHLVCKKASGMTGSGRPKDNT